MQDGGCGLVGAAPFSLQGVQAKLEGAFVETLRISLVGKEAWKEDFSSSYSAKTPEVEWLALFEKSEGEKVVCVACLLDHLAMGGFRSVQEWYRVRSPPKPRGFHRQLGYLCAFKFAVTI